MDKFIIILVAIAIIAFFFFQRSKSRSKISIHEHELLGKCFGDNDKAERLINLELKRNPKLSRENAAKYAIQSLKLDNR